MFGPLPRGLKGAVCTIGLVVLTVPGCAAGGEETLSGVDWRLVEVHEDDAAVPVPPGVSGSLRFDGTGGWSGQVCNTASGRAEVGRDQIRLDDGVVTAVACHADEARVEDSVRAVMASGTTLSWEVLDEWLTLTAEDGTRLVYRADR